MRDRRVLELKAIVKGSVQGVGFRAIVVQLADHLKLFGFVRNLSDGTVEICAQGSKAVLDELLEALRKKFGRNIQDIQTDFQPANEIYSNFQIIR